MSTALDHISSHILTQLDLHRAAHSTSAHPPPLFVALQGPQGSGKSYLSDLLRTHFSSPPHALRLAVLSIDDIYLPRPVLLAIASTHPTNRLWQGRGQPGTHDVELGVKLLAALKQGEGEVEIPKFDKSLYNGEGDRLPMDGSGAVVKGPLDVVLLEGWCVGFYPIEEEEVERRWNGAWGEERERLSLGVYSTENILDVNRALKEYVRMWSFFDVFVKLEPAPPEHDGSNLGPSRYAIVYKWRLEQEHWMKAHNGGRGMSDEAVKAFVDRYIPGYVFFGDTQPSNVNEFPHWIGRGLRVVIDEGREVVGTGGF